MSGGRPAFWQITYIHTYMEVSLLNVVMKSCQAFSCVLYTFFTHFKEDVQIKYHHAENGKGIYLKTKLALLEKV